MDHENFFTWLRVNDACEDAMEWVRIGQHTAETAYASCEPPEWLIWAAGTCGIESELIVEAAIRCTMTAYSEPDWITWAEAWLSGADRSRPAAKTAADMAWSAWLAAEATCVSAEVARAVVAAVWAAWAAGATGTDRVNWAARATWSAARGAGADTVRSVIPLDLFLAALNNGEGINHGQRSRR